MGDEHMENYVYLDTYVLQKDMRLRLPKTIIQNMNIIKGKTAFDIYMKSDKSEIILKVKKEGASDE